MDFASLITREYCPNKIWGRIRTTKYHIIPYLNTIFGIFIHKVQLFIDVQGVSWVTHRPGDEILVRELHFDHLSMTSGVVLRSALAASGGCFGMLWVWHPWHSL